MIQTLLSFISRLLLWGIFALAAWTVVRDWSYLMEAGGWFALLGQFMAVTWTLLFLVVLVLLGIVLLFLPLLIYFGVSEHQANEELSLARAAHLLVQGLRRLGRLTLRVANPIWKALWWTWWFLRRACYDG